jgi:hypothetical protein
MRNRLSLSLVLFLLALNPQNVYAQTIDLLKTQPVHLSCKFTSGHYTLLGKTKNSEIVWSFGLVLDKRNNVVYFTSDDRKELIKATYGLNRVQFPFQHLGDKKSIIVNLETLAFQMNYQDEVIKSVNNGVCSRR